MKILGHVDIVLIGNDIPKNKVDKDNVKDEAEQQLLGEDQSDRRQHSNI